MKYPQYRDELLLLLEEDQNEVRAHSRLFQESTDRSRIAESRMRLDEHVLSRAKRMLQILQAIVSPTIEHVGEDGSQAISILALHSRLSIMKTVLQAFLDSFAKDPASVYHEAIPTLSDRIAILERKKQLYGTQWMIDGAGKFFLYPVEDFDRLNERRKAYGLGPARYPRDLTYGIPAGPKPPKVQAQDMREPTEEELDEYARTYLD